MLVKAEGLPYFTAS